MRSTLILCDLDDADERRPGVGVVRIAIDGAETDLDVCEAHLNFLRTLPPVTADHETGPASTAKTKRPASRLKGAAATSRAVTGRRVKPVEPAQPTNGSRTPGSRRDRQERIAAARQWARANGREVADRGRLPAGLMDEFEAAHG